MAIAEMKKFTLLTFARHKDGLLKELQKFGDVHFRSLAPDELGELSLQTDASGEAAGRYEDELEKIKFIISKVAPYAEKPKGLKALTAAPLTVNYGEFDAYADTYEYASVYQTVFEENAAINSCRSEIAKLKSENEGLKLWSGLDTPPEALAFRYVSCVIGTVARLTADGFSASVAEKYNDVYIEFIGGAKDEALVLAFIPSDEFEQVYADLKTLGFSRSVPGFKGLPNDAEAENLRRIEELSDAQARSEGKIATMALEYEKLQIAHDYFQAALERENARQSFLRTETAVVMDGWVPTDSLPELKGILDKCCGDDYYLEEEDVERDSEAVPIKLKNNKMITAFEGITETFSMPKYNDVDPTPLLTPFYLLFFGFMLGDAGYGLILLAATGAALKFCHLNAGTTRFLKFFFYLSFATIFAGIIYGSAFGHTVFTPLIGPDGNPKAILDSQLDVVTMMILSVAIGVLQILFGLLIKAYVLAKNGDVFAAVCDALFWFAAVASGVGWLLGVVGVIPPLASTVSMWIFWLSLFGLAATQGRESKTIPTKIISGIYSVYGITSYVGDLVSYTRIAALALSGAYIAFAFNIMANLFPEGPVRMIFGTLVYLFGLFLNLGLSALGAYVHTLRLQYVEFFGKFYEGGGVPFNPFKIKNKYINIK